jgi:uncharacterized membrane protein (DUF2068 family)
MQNFPNNFPASTYSSSPPPPVQKKERGVLLTVVMGFATLGNLIATFGIVLGGAAFDRATQSGGAFESAGVHHVASRIIAVLALFQVMQMISVMGMWAWKRWALMGYFATSLMAALGAVKLTGEVPTWSLVWLALVLVGVFPRLAMFED